jgi:type I restriction enzyme S subunit
MAIKNLTPVMRGASPRPIEDPKYFDEEGEYGWVRISDVTRNHQYLHDTDQRLSKLGQSLSVALEPGSLFLSIAGSVGKPMITKIKACIHDGFVYFPHLNTDSNKYLLYIFESGQPYKGLGKLGTQLNLNTDTVGSIKIPVPPLTDQQKIADFLDRKTAQIDGLIEKKRALIAKLKEKRLAVITQAVTRGLNPEAPLKDSGIEWLGQVPEHWEVRRLKFYTDRVFTGATPPSSEPKYFEDVSLNWFTPGDFEESGCILKNARRKINISAVEDGVVKYFTKSSILLIGIGATLGRVGISLEPFSCNQQINVVVPSHEIEPEFLYYSLLAKQETMRTLSNAATLGIMNQETTRQVDITAPITDEQNRIIKHLNVTTTQIAKVANKTEQAIDRLTEYRTALITAAVTGQLEINLENKPSIHLAPFLTQ